MCFFFLSNLHYNHIPSATASLIQIIGGVLKISNKQLTGLLNEC